MFGSPFFLTPNVEKCSPHFVPHISKERFRAKCEKNHSKIALYYHLSMVCTYMSKETAIFVAIGKILKYLHADMSLRVAVLSFSILTFSFKYWVLLSLSKSSPFWFPTAQISFSSPFPFWNLQSLDSIDLLISKKFIGYRVCHNTKASFVSIEWVIWYSVEGDNFQQWVSHFYCVWWNVELKMYCQRKIK